VGKPAWIHGSSSRGLVDGGRILLADLRFGVTLPILWRRMPESSSTQVGFDFSRDPLFRWDPIDCHIGAVCRHLRRGGVLFAIKTIWRWRRLLRVGAGVGVFMSLGCRSFDHHADRSTPSFGAFPEGQSPINAEHYRNRLAGRSRGREKFGGPTLAALCLASARRPPSLTRRAAIPLS